jgi:hypothetical protein
VSTSEAAEKADYPLISNAKFIRNSNHTKPFTVEDTAELISLRDKVVAIPDLFGYTKEEGETVFPPYFYPN